VAVDADTPVRFVATLCFFCLAPGAAILAVLKPSARRFELGLVAGLSLSTLTLVAMAMLPAHAWDPNVATYIAAVACLAVVVPRLHGARWRFSRFEADDPRAEPRQPDVPAGDPLAPSRHPVEPRPKPSAPGATALAVADPFASARDLPAEANGTTKTAGALSAGRLVRRAISALLLFAAIYLWVVALHRTDLGDISGYGLLTALPVEYYAALILIAAGFVLAVSERGPAPLLLAAHALALILVLHGTTAVLYAEPRYTYTFKHLGVIDYIARHGAVDRSIDIYQNWPGFFALNALFQREGGVAAFSYAPWAQVFFETFSLAAILFAVRGLTRDVRLQWTTAWFFLVADWPAQNYLAPQAMGFPLVFLITGLCVRCAPYPGPWQWRVGRRFRAWLARFGRPRARPRSPDGPWDGFLTSRHAVVAGALLFLAVVVTHQLSPAMLIVAVTFFAIATGRLPLRLVAAMAAVEAVWLAWSWPYLSKHFDLISPGLFITSRPQGENPGRALPGAALVANMAKAVVVAMALLALAGAVKQIRLRRLQLPPVAFALAPVAIVPWQSYGGEILFRAFLFALPWLAFFAAVACVPSLSRRTPALLRPWRLAAATAAVGTAFLFAYFGLEKINHVTPADVAAVTWFERHAPNDALLAHMAPGVPDRLNANYARLRFEGDWWVPRLDHLDVLRKHLATRRDLPAITSLLRGPHDLNTYLSVTPSEGSYTRLFGIMPPGAAPRLAGVLRRSREFRLVYRHGDAFIFRLTPAGARPR
jgi:hypothetical protein